MDRQMLMSGSAWVGGHSTSRVSEERSLRLEPALEVPLSYRRGLEASLVVLFCVSRKVRARVGC